MRIIFSEYLTNYKTYSYAYGVYAIMENISDLSEIYNSGFLTYLGSPDIKNHFYMCRSLRIDLGRWSLNSENKRILKKHNLDLKKVVYKNFKEMSKDEYNNFYDLFLNYFKDVHGENIMPKERLDFVFAQEYINRIVVYKDNNKKIVGGVLMIETAEHIHYPYSAYISELKNSGFGLWMFLDEIRESIKRRLNYFYLGTCYGEKAKYKLNFEALEFFDGSGWNKDIKELKKRIKDDYIKDKEFDLLKKDKKLF